MFARRRVSDGINGCSGANVLPSPLEPFFEINPWSHRPIESQPRIREGRMTVSGAKVYTADEKSPVKVRRKNAPVLDLRRISVLGGLSGRLIGHTGDQTP